MTASLQRRLLWPLLALAAVAAVGAGTRVSLTEPVVTLVGVVLTTLGVAVLVALPGLATLALLSKRSLTAASRFGLLLSGSGIAAFIDFWAWVPSPTLGRVVSIGFLAASAAVIAAAHPTVLLEDRELRWPLGVLLLVVLGYVGLAYSQGGFGGVHWITGGVAGNTTLSMSYRYWGTPDNTIPFVFAQRLANHGSLTAPFIGGQTSDRPPLQTGFTLMLYPLLGQPNFAYQLLGTVLQALWIPALWILLRSRGVSVARVLLVVLCTAATGVIFFNTVYIWPKMLAGAFILVALAVILEGGSLTLAAVLTALALLSHGGVAFSVPALLLVAWRLRPSAVRVASAVAAGVVLYLPWIAYQQFLNPPGNLLLKWQLAGVTKPDRHSFLHDLVNAYGHNPFHAFVTYKLHNLETLAVIPSVWSKLAPGSTAFLAAARAGELTSLLLGIGPLLLGLAALASARARRSLGPLRPVAVFLLVSLVFWVILEYGRNYASATETHQGSYAVLVLAVALPALAATYLPRLAAAAIIAVSVGWFVVAWVPGLGFQWSQPGLATATDWSMVALGLAALAALGSIVWRRTRIRLGRDELFARPLRADRTVRPAPPV